MTDMTGDGNDRFYDVLVDEHRRRVHQVEASQADQKPRSLVGRPAGRSTGLVLLDFITLLLILMLPVSWMQSFLWFGVNAAVLVSLVLTVYFSLVVKVLAVLGPPDRPHVIAIVKAPERLYCPRCGDEKTDRYCSTCGVNVEKEYGKIASRLAQYAVEDTQEQRQYLEEYLADRLSKLADEQRRHVQKMLDSLERNYVMEIVRLRKIISDHRRHALHVARMLTDDGGNEPAEAAQESERWTS